MIDDPLIALALVMLSIGMLYLGSEWLVKGASRLAFLLGISPFIVGLTVVAFGTSAPESFLTTTAALQGDSGIAIGNVVGSNIVNIALIVGLAAILVPINFQYKVLKADSMIMLGAFALIAIMGSRGVFGLIEGAVLLVLFSLFLANTWSLARKERNANRMESQVTEEMGRPLRNEFWRYIAMILAGLALLALGSQALIEGATSLATHLGLSDLVIGLTIVAVGTSVPELSVSILSVFRKHGDIAISNVIGSNIFNILLVLGLGAVLNPMSVSPSDIALSVWVMILLGGFMVLSLKLRDGITRYMGAAMLLVYAGYVALLMAQ